MHSGRLIHLLFLVIIPISLWSQQKYEAESRISRKEVPKAMSDFIGNCCEQYTIKWYKEQQSNTYSYEAKFKKSGVLFSLEFDLNGRLEDIEKRVDIDDLPLKLQNKIHSTLDNTFDQIRIQKVQIQYSGEEKVLKDLMKEDILDDGIAIRYELIVLGKLGQQVSKWEVLFDKNGELLQRFRLVNRNQDNLNY